MAGSGSPVSAGPSPALADSISKAILPSLSTTLTWPPRTSLPNRMSSASGFLMFYWITRASGLAP